MTEASSNFPCLLLAGGLSRRMGGGAKFLQMLDGKTLLARIIETLQPQVSEFILNMNIEIGDAAPTGIPVVKDSVAGFAGPLAGILTGLEYFQQKQVSSTHMLSIPTDAPFIPADLVSRLAAELEGSTRKIVMANSVGRVHPVVALWPIALAEDLRMALVDEDLRKILVFAERYDLTEVKWGEDEGDPFFNINCTDDLEAARLKLSAENA